MERSMERSGGGHGGQSVFPLSFWSLKTHEYALTATTSLALGMYLCCVYRDPGRVPAGYAPDPESAAARGALVELKRRRLALLQEVRARSPGARTTAASATAAFYAWTTTASG